MEHPHKPWKHSEKFKESMENHEKPWLMDGEWGIVGILSNLIGILICDIYHPVYCSWKIPELNGGL